MRKLSLVGLLLIVVALNNSFAKSIFNDHSRITSNADIATFKKELTMIWFGHNAFRHVFCGEPNRSKLGGMHFVGRYLKAQEQGWAGIAENALKKK